MTLILLQNQNGNGNCTNGNGNCINGNGNGKNGAIGRGGHVLVFPFPAQGHMIPLLDLTQHLMKRGGMFATILVTPKNLPLIEPVLSRHPDSSAPLIIPFPADTSLPGGEENTKDMPPNSFDVTMVALRRLRPSIEQWFRSHPSPPAAIISDMFLGWTHSLASELGIRRLVFCPSGAMALSVAHALWIDLPNTDSEVVSLDRVPGRPKFPLWQVSPLYRGYMAGEPNSRHIREEFMENVASWGFVFNSLDDLEGVYLRHMAKAVGHGRVFAVGPLFPPPGPEEEEHEEENNNSNGSSSSSSSNAAAAGRGASGPVEGAAGDVMSWLDNCQTKGESVVYVCFGSQAVLSNEQMEAVALGLDRSGVRFVWCVKELRTGQVDGDKFGKVPQWFVDRAAAAATGGKGLVIKGWAPQVPILRHAAVVSFFTHCGWNSLLEGLSSGKMMLAWPMGADQFANAVLLEDDHVKVGVRVCEGKSCVPDPDVLARHLADSVGERRSEERRRAMEIRGKAWEAIAHTGSSSKDLDRLVKEIALLVPKKKMMIVKENKSDEQ